VEIYVKKMETEDEITGKAYVHWKAWHEAYPGIVSQDYLDGLTLEKCEAIARSWPDRIFVAKDHERVIGFVGYGDRGDEAPGVGEVFSIYVLSEYYGKGVGQILMEVALKQLNGYSEICLWVLKENKRAIRFYEKCGFQPDGAQMVSSACKACEIRMVYREGRQGKNADLSCEVS